MSTTANWIGLRLDPLDTLFFRDGRPFDAANRVVGGLPTPQTLAGAIRTALLGRLGFDFAKFSRLRKDDPQRFRAALEASGSPECRPVFDAHFRGAWLALADGAAGVETPLLAMPETLKRAKDKTGYMWSIAEPVPSVPGWSDPHLHPLWREHETDSKADSLLLKLSGLTKFLAGNTTQIDPKTDCVKRDGLTAADHRIGIEIHKDTLTSAEGQLYAISLLATRPERKTKDESKGEVKIEPAICLYAEIALPKALQPLLHEQLVPFGGEGKYVRVITCKPVFPSFAKEQTTGPALWYLATPTFFDPKGPPLPKLDSTLKAAASGAGVPVSGWDVARNGPRPTRFVVPAGAVYFVEGDVQSTDFLNNGNKDESRDLRQEGWGFALPGTWEGLK